MPLGLFLWKKKIASEKVLVAKTRLASNMLKRCHVASFFRFAYGRYVVKQQSVTPRKKALKFTIFPQF